MDTNTYPTRVTVKTACAIVGGDEPIDVSTYYRGVKRGIYPAPDKVGPNIARVDTAKLLAAIEVRVNKAA
jgi:hypothetical protein